MLELVRAAFRFRHDGHQHGDLAVHGATWKSGNAHGGRSHGEGPALASHLA